MKKKEYEKAVKLLTNLEINQLTRHRPVEYIYDNVAFRDKYLNHGLLRMDEDYAQATAIIDKECSDRILVINKMYNKFDFWEYKPDKGNYALFFARKN